MDVSLIWTVRSFQTAQSSGRKPCACHAFAIERAHTGQQGGMLSLLASTDERTDGWLRARTLLLLGGGGGGDVAAGMVVRSRLLMLAAGGAGGVQGSRCLLRRELLVGRGADDVG